MTAIYREYAQEELDRQYDNSRAVPEHERFFNLYRELSERARGELTCRLDVAYGTSSMEKLDVFPSGKTDAPTWIFIHGGYWRRLDKSDFSFVADPFTSAGISVVSVNYALAPNVSVAEIARQVRAATRWTLEHAHDWEGDPARVFIGGHSVGGQLAALAAAAEDVQGVTSISGLADLEPVALSYVNEWARLAGDDIVSLSPVHQVPKRELPLIAYAGAKETDEFRRQTAILADAWRARNYTVDEGYVAGEDHFSIALELHDPWSDLTKAILAQCLGRTGNASGSA
ncbi:MAG: alpha/beta hydrolase [Vulcanimicrobiaceae bacterium]